MKITLQFDSMDEFEEFRGKAGLPAADSPKLTPLDHELDNRNMNVRLLNCLKAEGIFYVEDALKLTRSKVVRFPNVGKLTADQFEAWKQDRLSTIPD